MNEFKMLIFTYNSDRRVYKRKERRTNVIFLKDENILYKMICLKHFLKI